jgi:predicted  nucleic acid-binding Zn-ribbon protein
MNDLRRELRLLISIAKVDADLNAYRTEMALLPAKIEVVNKSVEKIDKAMSEAAEHYEDMKKERRSLERILDDHTEKITKLRTKLMEVKTNKEYTAMLSEIEHLEKGVDDKEERLLILMDELDQQSTRNQGFTSENEQKKKDLLTKKANVENRMKTLGETVKRLEAEKPKILAELDPLTKKRYDRILTKLGDFAVTHVEDDICHGCFSRIPPQTALEVKRNDQIISCEVCGRILVFYGA